MALNFVKAIVRYFSRFSFIKNAHFCILQNPNQMSPLFLLCGALCLLSFLRFLAEIPSSSAISRARDAATCARYQSLCERKRKNFVP